MAAKTITVEMLSEGDSEDKDGDACGDAWGIFYFICPHMRRNLANKANFTSWELVFGWPNPQLQRFNPGENRANSRMVKFMTDVINRRMRLCAQYGDRALDFNAARFPITDDPFVIIGPIKNCSHQLVADMHGSVPLDWIHSMVRIPAQKAKK